MVRTSEFVVRSFRVAASHPTVRNIRVLRGGMLLRMRIALQLILALVVVALSAVMPQAQGRGNQATTIRAARVFDGRGGVLANGVVEVRGSRIVAVDQRPGPVTIDLGDSTLLPGFIDVHVHL